MNRSPFWFSLQRLLASFRYAFAGIYYLATQEQNFRVHLLASIIVIGLGIILQVSRQDWIALFLAIGLVLTAEAINTTLELILDALRPERHPLIGRAKDVSAGAVLTAALIALIIGILVFLPPLFAYFTSPAQITP